MAGVGLATLLSPLVGSALATAGQVVNVSDPTAANTAKVDSAGKLYVGDGAGPLSVDGTVSGRSAAPASPWHASDDVSSFGSPGALNITSVSLSTNAPSGFGPEVLLYARHVPSSATDCSGATFDGALWRVLNAGGQTTPVVVTFPTPLQWKPIGNAKACLFAFGQSTYAVVVNAAGFYGG
jgi:hypothetical protein